MSTRLSWLDGAGWAAIEPLLPTRRRGAYRVDDRQVIPNIMHILRGARDGGIVRPSTARTRRFTIASTVGAGKAGVREDIFYALTGSRPGASVGDGVDRRHAQQGAPFGR